MIYAWEEQSLILTPPKTASSSLHLSLCNRNGYLYVLSLTNWGKISKHCALDELGERPLEFALGHDIAVILTVRHPVDRIISMYRHQVRFDGYEGCFEQWVDEEDRAGGGVHWLRSCHAHLGGQTADGVLRTECLSDDLSQLGLPEVSSRINVSDKLYTADRTFAEETSRRWWPDDWQYYQTSMPTS